MSLYQILLIVRPFYHKLPLPSWARRWVSLAYHTVLRPCYRWCRRTISRAVRARIPKGTQVTGSSGLPDYIIWGVIDWHFRHQRPQQIAMQVAATQRRVFYVSPLLVDDERDGFLVEPLDSSGRLFQIRLFARCAPSIYPKTPTPTVVDQLRRSLGEVLQWANCDRVISLVQHPFWSDTASVIPNRELVYDCMDHHEGFGGMENNLMELEQQLIREADLTITTSAWLDQSVADQSRHRALIRNAADYELFSQKPEDIYREPKNRRIIGYYGAIAGWFDIDLVEAVAKRYPDCAIVLIGNDTANAKSRLRAFPNVSFLGEVPYVKLPYYLHSFDVCLLPFKVLPITLATNPVKTYEYLSAGKPVVAIDIPEMKQFGELVYVEADHDEFIRAVGHVLSAPESPDLGERRRAFAQGQTWRHRAEELIRQIESVDREERVSVIVVTYNNLELTRACLASIDEQSQYTNLEIIVVDNASQDGSKEFLTGWASAGDNRRLILNEINRGFSAANNQGLNEATGTYLVLLNNDTYVTPGWIRSLINHLKRDTTIGLIGPVTNNIGNEAKIDIEYVDMDDMLTKSAAHTRRHAGQLYPLRTAAFFCVMMKRTVFEHVGHLDESFGRGWFEDDDYCRRVELAGWRITCADDVFIHHQLSASFNLMPSQDRQALFQENQRIYEAKWGMWIPHSYRPKIPPLAITRDNPSPYAGWRYISGFCNVCGQVSRFFYHDASQWRESLYCEHCHVSSRYRSIARGVLRAIGEWTKHDVRSLSSLPQDGTTRLRVYDTQPPFYWARCAYSLPDLLKAVRWITVELSRYRPDLPLGTVLDKGVTNQNLERLTFSDGEIDLVITSDVMEHVRLDDRAYREIYRVLKPGGIYIFTVPHNRSYERTLVRVQVTDPDDPTKDVHLLEPEYHGDTNSEGGPNALSYRVYGQDLDRYLTGLGFEVEYLDDGVANVGILKAELYYCRKPARASNSIVNI